MATQMPKPPVPPSSLVSLLQRAALDQPDKRAYTFLVDGESEQVHLTCAELDRQARAIGAILQSLGATGKPVLLLYPPGLEYISGFFGCLYAGAIAVPAYPPDISRLDRSLPRLQAIVSSSGAAIALTTGTILSMASYVFAQAPDLARLHWAATDALAAGVENDWVEPTVGQDTLAFLQYTSGSTRTPRGVMLSHGNLIHNLGLIREGFEITSQDIGVIWLPPYHDMGLIGGILQPIYAGVYCVLMSPLSFLQRPFRWLQAVSRYRGTVSGGPNFAYDLCARKVTPEQLSKLDLSCWAVAFNGAEPVYRETIDRFAETFGPCGFRREAFYPCYGLAEATLIVSGGTRSAAPVYYSAQKAALERGEVVAAAEGDAGAQTLVGCGRPLGDQEVCIVDPASSAASPPDKVGEIWVSGPSVAGGYWGQPDETEQTFRASPVQTGAGPFLRTGDLGFLRDGQVYVAGRIKDLIIVDGLNHYPQDIERTVEQCHPALRPGCSAAFSIPVDGQERLIVAAEFEARSGVNSQSVDPESIVQDIRRAVAAQHDLRVHDVVLLKARSIPKTSSGKVQRHACRVGYLTGTLEVWGRQ